MLESRSPWDGQLVAALPSTPLPALAGLAGRLAAEQPRWAAPGAGGADARRQGLERLAEVLTRARPALVQALIREAGKCRADAEAEADLLPRKIAITLGAGLERTPPAGEGPIRWRARGLAAAIGPSNFPLHLLHGLVVPALAVGCTVIAKPSERCPGLGAAYAEAITAAGLDQVVGVVQGGAELSLALAREPLVQSLAAVGGRAMGRALALAMAERPEAVLALELGGVNQALVLDDADAGLAVLALAEGAWRMAGQRCTATRIVHLPAARQQELTLALAQARARYLPAENPEGAVGRMITSAASASFRARYHDLPAGLQLVAGGQEEAAGAACPPLLLALRDPDARMHALYRQEQFGPALIIDPYHQEAEAVARMRENPARLAAAIFTASRERFLALAEQLPYGQVNWNRPTAGARSDLPFGGCGESGNGHPAALAAGRIFADETVVWA